MKEASSASIMNYLYKAPKNKQYPNPELHQLLFNVDAIANHPASKDREEIELELRLAQADLNRIATQTPPLPLLPSSSPPPSPRPPPLPLSSPPSLSSTPTPTSAPTPSLVYPSFSFYVASLPASPPVSPLSSCVFSPSSPPLCPLPPPAQERSVSPIGREQSFSSERSVSPIGREQAEPSVSPERSRIDQFHPDHRPGHHLDKSGLRRRFLSQVFQKQKNP